MRRNSANRARHRSTRSPKRAGHRRAQERTEALELPNDDEVTTELQRAVCAARGNHGEQVERVRTEQTRLRATGKKQLRCCDRGSKHVRAGEVGTRGRGNSLSRREEQGAGSSEGTTSSTARERGELPQGSRAPEAPRLGMAAMGRELVEEGAAACRSSAHRGIRAEAEHAPWGTRRQGRESWRRGLLGDGEKEMSSAGWGWGSAGEPPWEQAKGEQDAPRESWKEQRRPRKMTRQDI
jgi:hypothetical protein|uniref:Uncharacterized protein n=1 Tax=Zea mays TaxID=4577 RepID=A0A804MMS3_MAIZE